ncbi:MAG: hypothetical protein V2A34_04030 [Lentisphaerota bacterium]
MFAALSQCSFFPFGDEATYIGQVGKLRQGYLSQNIQAFKNRMAGLPAKPGKLVTEGAFAFILFACYQVHPLLPFMINSLLTVCILMGMAWLLFRLDSHRLRGALTALFFLLWMMSQPTFTRLVWEMARPLRDAPAHLLGLAGLLCCTGVVRQGRIRWALAFLGGLLIGLAAWARIPDVLFAVPAAVGLLISAQGLTWKKRWMVLAACALGGLLGLLPMFAQNVLEGKNFYSPGQAEALAFSEERQVASVSAQTIHGLHAQNFRPTLQKAIQVSSHILSKGFLIWLGIGLVFGILRDRSRTAILSSGALVFILFYSFYHTVILRYWFPAYLFLAALAAIPAGALLQAWIKTRARHRLATGIILMLTFGICGMSFSNANSASSFFAQLHKVRQFQTWVQDTFTNHEYFISNRHGIGALLDLLGTPLPKNTSWGTDAEGVPAIERVKARLDRGDRVYFLTYTNSQQRISSWWLDDMQNDFDVLPLDRSFPMSQWNINITGFEVVPRGRQALLELNVHTGQVSGIFLYARRLSTTNRWQQVAVEAPGFHLQTSIQAGPNFLILPKPITAPALLALSISSDDPLPSFSKIVPLGDDPVVLKFNDYDTIYSMHLMVPEAVLHWRGSRQWAYDLGGDGQKSHESSPALYIPANLAIRFPKSSQDFSAQLYLILNGPPRIGADRTKEFLRFSQNGRDLSYTYTMTQIGDRGRHTFLITLTLPLKGSSAGSASPDVLLLTQAYPAASLKLERIDLFPRFSNPATP